MKSRFMNSVEVIKTLPKSGVLKRVAGYARVSTSDEHQDSSFRMQMEELEKTIKENPLYEFIGIFKDKKSGTRTKNRTEFNTMIELALANEIDVIITKSITRFARDILTTITLIRELKSYDVEVIFQKENISSLDPTMEFLLSVLAMQAEEESKNISDNTKWNIKRKVRAGGNMTTFLFGYSIKGEEWTIVESEAKVVRMIFDMYLKGKSYKSIIDKLFRLGIKTSKGNARWNQGTIEQMVQNEKYAGHMSLGKTYILNGTTLRSKRVNRDDHFIMNHHKPIVSPSVFDDAIKLRAKRTRNELQVYVPLSKRVTPYYQFVFSSENKKYLKYVVERPKGKYEIPTLYCYNSQKTNRVMLTINNLFALVNDALDKVKGSSSTLASKITMYINTALSSYEEKLINPQSDKAEILSKKIKMLGCKKKLPNFVKQVKSFSPATNIEDIKRLVNKVTINNISDINIRLNLINDDALSIYLLSSSVNLKLGYKNININYSVYI